MGDYAPDDEYWLQASGQGIAIMFRCLRRIEKKIDDVAITCNYIKARIDGNVIANADPGRALNQYQVRENKLDDILKLLKKKLSTNSEAVIAPPVPSIDLPKPRVKKVEMSWKIPSQFTEFLFQYVFPGE